MIFQPTNIEPSSLNGTGTIDATEDLTIRWQVNGDSPMLAYQIVIYENDESSTVLLDTEKITLSAPFYGTSYNGTTPTFSADTITAATLADSDILNGTANGYKIIITQWWSNDDYVVQSSASQFIARATPQLSIDAIPTPIPARTYSFTATCVLDTSDSIRWVQWKIYTNSGESLLDTGAIFGTSELRVDYDGFFSGNEYKIQCSIETNNGIIVSTPITEFSVSYPLGESVGEIEARCLGNEDCIAVSWGGVISYNGSPSGSYEITDGDLVLLDGNWVTWDNGNNAPIIFVPPWTAVWRGHIYGYGTFLEINSALGSSPSGQLIFEEGVVKYAQTGTGAIYAQASYSGSPQGWWTVIITPSKLYIKREYPSGGLHPAEDLYPSETLYPSEDDELSLITYDATMLPVYAQETIGSIILYGLQKCDFLWVVDGVLSDADILDIMSSYGFEPTWTSATIFLASFSVGLNAGNLDAIGYSLYRLDNGSSILLHLCDVDISVLAVKDFGIKNQKSYTYYLFYRSATGYLNQPLISETVTPNFWSWTVFNCENRTTDASYGVTNTYRFALNVDSGTINNNNTPNILQNFTRYPLVQSSPSNYKSGTLQSYIGSVNYVDSTYQDSVSLADAMYALSVDNRPKFLRDRKGNLLGVTPAGAIGMTNRDVSPKQPYTISLPWVEVASTSGIKIYNYYGEDNWGTDNVDTTTVRVDMDTGNLIWEYPDNYSNGSILTLSEGGYLTQTWDVLVKPDDLQLQDDGNLVIVT